jgi:hypothetical protein
MRSQLSSTTCASLREGKTAPLGFMVASLGNRQSPQQYVRRATFAERAKQQRNLPMPISFVAWRKRAGIAQNVAPMLSKFRFAVERSV